MDIRILPLSAFSQQYFMQHPSKVMYLKVEGKAEDSAAEARSSRSLFLAFLTKIPKITMFSAYLKIIQVCPL
jgi:hypothetical protein